MAENIDIKIGADASSFVATLKSLEKLSDSFGAHLTGALKMATVGGRELEDVLRSLGMNIAGMALGHGLKPLQALGSSLFKNILQGLQGILPFANGGVTGGVTPFAAGGVVSSPTYFPNGKQLGLMGEAGAEAILPLRRGADGSLGVAAPGGGGAVNVVFNVTAQDASSFRKSEAQITGMLARAVARRANVLRRQRDGVQQFP